MKKISELEGLPVDISEEEKAEIEKTEKEVGVEEQEFICIVHKGIIRGTIYTCPSCKTLYCLKCAMALKEKGEKCWSCKLEFEL